MGRGSRTGNDASVNVRETLLERRGRGGQGWQAAAVTVEELDREVTAMLNAQDPFSQHLRSTGSRGRLTRPMDDRPKGTPYVMVSWRSERGSAGTDGADWLARQLEGRSLAAGEHWRARQLTRQDEHCARVYPA